MLSASEQPQNQVLPAALWPPLPGLEPAASPRGPSFSTPLGAGI